MGYRSAMLPAALALLLAAAAPSPAEAHLERARELLHQMRYEPALAELGAARSEPELPAKLRAQIELETGIAEVDLLHDASARAAFRAALALDPRAELPPGLSPRIVQTWLEVRAEVAAAAPPHPVDVPAAPAPPSNATPAAVPASVAALSPPPPATKRSTLATVGPFALMGAGVAAGIAGGAFGLRASADHEEAGSAQVQLVAVDANASARAHATAANVLFATAGALAVAGVVWLLAR